ncbi:MAG: nickel pincer cofactor biosynthesis protein LarC [Desulfobulbus sp.]|nr:MAG: nickel pincer cofactor biosynthesis protein LarC [Desulfobulbus sp.]
MHIAYLDCFSGVSGNMLLGALLEVGLSEESLRASLEALHLPDWDIEIQQNNVSGLRSCLVRVRSKEYTSHRHLQDIRKILEQASLPEQVKARVTAVFIRLAQAEAQVHGTQIEDVHFHEVGAVDAIIDIVGVVSGFHILGIQQICCSPMPMPSGWVACAHGTLPLPAPAVCNLLAGIPVYGTSLSQELVTPTGAALVAELCSSFGPLPFMTLSATGYGAGTTQRKDGRPNILRLIIGQTCQEQETQQVEIIETNLDDWNPELWPHVSEKLMATGALDVSLSPLLMKKGRPGHLLRVITDPAHATALKELILAETSSIGLRFHSMQRMTLPREIITVQTPWGKVQAKRVKIGGKERITPEYEACRKIAMENNVPLQQVYQAVTRNISV